MLLKILISLKIDNSYLFTLIHKNLGVYYYYYFDCKRFGLLFKIFINQYYHEKSFTMKMRLKNYTNWRFIYAKNKLCHLSCICLISSKKVSPKTTFFIPYAQKPEEKIYSLHQTARNSHFNMSPTRHQLRTLFYRTYPMTVKEYPTL